MITGTDVVPIQAAIEVFKWSPLSVLTSLSTSWWKDNGSQTTLSK